MKKLSEGTIVLNGINIKVKLFEGMRKGRLLLKPTATLRVKRPTYKELYSFYKAKGGEM